MVVGRRVNVLPEAGAQGNAGEAALLNQAAVGASQSRVAGGERVFEGGKDVLGEDKGAAVHALGLVEPLADGGDAVVVGEADVGGVVFVHAFAGGEVHQQVGAAVVGDAGEEVAQGAGVEEVVGHEQQEALLVADGLAGLQEREPVFGAPVGVAEAADGEAIEMELFDALPDGVALIADHQQDGPDVRFLQGVKVAFEQGYAQEVHQALGAAIGHGAQALSIACAQHDGSLDGREGLFRCDHVVPPKTR